MNCSIQTTATAQGYKTIRIPTSDLSAETIDSYLKELYN